MQAISLNNILIMKEKLQNGVTIMYGAGGNGERILKIFKEYSIRIHYFCDDDYNKWNTYFHNIPIISFEELIKLTKNIKINVILTSVFAGPIMGKLRDINVTIYEPFSILIDKYYQNSFYKVRLNECDIKDIWKKIQVVIDYINDIESKRILRKIVDVIKAPDDMQYSHFFDVASKEDCYFIKEVLKAMPAHPVILDCGGFTGDLMVALKKYRIDYKKVYSFEVNQELFNSMQKNIKENLLENKFMPINKGVWNSSGKAYLNVKSDDIAGGMVSNCSDGILIDTIKIDDYFENIAFDFIKMDIEGAELHALRGGINSIKRYRPIMAISLYHSVNDIVDIPLYLFEKLVNYHYFIRHHSFIDTETVFYCIPYERLNKYENI